MTRKNLSELQEAATHSDTGIICPACHCRDFRTYGVTQGQSVAVRYKSCRNCGHRILTSTQTQEHIIRDVETRNEDGDET
ncbi:unnamed protein product [marine sediment metagenome]|uniref:Uncharacterized protein n=1 Tax=marine sediment metagenome TaxID=412755 RepID=X0UG74_9ZZZZ